MLEGGPTRIEGFIKSHIYTVHKVMISMDSMPQHSKSDASKGYRDAGLGNKRMAYGSSSFDLRKITNSRGRGLSDGNGLTNVAG